MQLPNFYEVNKIMPMMMCTMFCKYTEFCHFNFEVNQTNSTVVRANLMCVAAPQPSLCVLLLCPYINMSVMVKISYLNHLISKLRFLCFLAVFISIYITVAKILAAVFQALNHNSG